MIYHLPWARLPDLTRDLLSGRERSLMGDIQAMWSGLGPLDVEGTGNIPAQGSFLIAANHYQRHGLWIGWAGSLISLVVADKRRGMVPHWLVTGGLRLLQWRNAGPYVVGSGLLFERVAKVYGMTALSPRDPVRRALSLRHWLGYAQSGEVLAMFPEGLAGRSSRLTLYEPGIDRLMHRLQRLDVPVLPVGVYEWDGRLRARFGSLLPPTDSTEKVMHAIAALVPERMRGPYGSPVGPLG